MRLRTMAGLAVGGMLLDAAVLAPRRFRIHDVPLAVPGWPASLDGLRVALVGDLHAGAPWVDLARARSVVNSVIEAKPDLVLLLGDHVADVTFGTHLEPGQVARELGGLLRAGVPVLGVLGNHDWYAGGWRMRAALEETGLPVLEETAVSVLDDRLWVAGVGDLWERTPSVAAALAHVPPGAPVLLMTHNPDVVADVPPSVQLVVAGHTHGGQLAFRGHPYHRVSERTGNRFSRGRWYGEDRLYVTAGIGSSLIPLRSVTPEVPVLVLRAP
ncbi:MAG: metallophosphoesterase [Frankiaceae bacterium]|nr:metallophosphoesterase [Frankiaceae bacterium]